MKPVNPQNDGNQNINLQDSSSGKNLKDQPKLKKIKTRTTIVEHKENEDEVYEKIKDSRFKQQRLPAWRPVPTITAIIIVFSVFGIIFIILGVILLIYSSKVKSIEIDYTNCPIIIDSSTSPCSQEKTLEEDIDKPVFIYYQLDGFYQNSRRYVKSKNIDQLRGESDSTEDCEPAEYNSEMGFSSDKKAIDGTTNLIMESKAIPCGLMAKTFFNDTYKFYLDSQLINVDERNIAFDKDRDLYKKERDRSKQWHSLKDEHFIVWMRPSGLPNPRKLWGKINQDLKKGTKIKVEITNNYDVSSFKGKKKIILSNATVFGGKNKFLAISYIVAGCLSIVCAIIFPIGYKFQLAKEKVL